MNATVKLRMNLQKKIHLDRLFAFTVELLAQLLCVVSCQYYCKVRHRLVRRV